MKVSAKKTFSQMRSGVIISDAGTYCYLSKKFYIVKFPLTITALMKYDPIITLLFQNWVEIFKLALDTGVFWISKTVNLLSVKPTQKIRLLNCLKFKFHITWEKICLLT